MSFPQTFSPESRVWIYQSDRPFTAEETARLQPMLDEFAAQWVSHNRQLKAAGKLLYDRFIVLMVDETQAGASGCSIDKSVYFLKELEKAFGVSLFDRLTFAWREGEEVQAAPQEAFRKLYQKGEITDDTLVFDNLIKTREELENRWLRPLKETWHKRMV